MQKIEFIQILDEEGAVMLAKTNMTETEISTAVYDETLDDNNCDYEEKLLAHAEMLNKHFERVYVDKRVFV